ncbi:hypothetical protein TKK_0017277 [Trichogramma kaykai]
MAIVTLYSTDILLASNYAIPLETKTPAEGGSVVEVSLALYRGQYFAARPSLSWRRSSLYEGSLHATIRPTVVQLGSSSA